jgi:hypothetical protein
MCKFIMTSVRPLICKCVTKACFGKGIFLLFDLKYQFLTNYNFDQKMFQKYLEKKMFVRIFCKRHKMSTKKPFFFSFFNVMSTGPSRNFTPSGTHRKREKERERGERGEREGRERGERGERERERGERER